MSQVSDELVSRRRDMVARRRALKAEMTKLASDITAIDRVMTMLDPAYVPEANRANRKRSTGSSKLFGWGEMTPAALEALRLVGKPATSAEVAAAIMAGKGVGADDDTQAELAGKVTSAFVAKAASGQVRRVGNGDGKQVLWEVAR